MFGMSSLWRTRHRLNNKRKGELCRLTPRGNLIVGLILCLVVADWWNPFSSSSTSSLELATLEATESSSSSIETLEEKADNCSRILLYASDYLKKAGLGAQLNVLLQAVSVALVEDRRLVFLHSNNESMFGCPSSSSSSSSSPHTLYRPGGLGHIIDTSPMNHASCSIPTRCHTEEEWRHQAYLVCQSPHLYEMHKDSIHTTCKSNHGDDKEKEQDVLLLGGFVLQRYYRDEYHQQLATAEGIQDWGLRLGFFRDEMPVLEEQANSNTNKATYRQRIIKSVRSLVRFQPWITADVQNILLNYTTEVPIQEMVGMHIRRGDKLKVESRRYVEEYWRTHGGYTPQTMPVNYVPLVAYMEHVPRDRRHIYIATDDPTTVKKEISELSDRDHWIFHFNPLAPSGHLDTLEDCHAKYEHTIAAIFDLTVLETSAIFVGELSSNWGRWVDFRRDGEKRIVFGPELPE